MIYLLSKFFSSEQYAEEFMLGRLYANRLAYFRALEGDPARSDAHEGVSLLQGDVHLYPSIDGSQNESITIREHELSVPSELAMNWTEHVNLICMHALHSGDYKNISSEQVDEFNKEQIEVPEECLIFGEYAVVITNVTEFMRRVRDAVQKIEGYRLCRGLVRYGGKPPIDVTGVETLFHKHERYSRQREYRFAVFTASEICDPLVLETGGLSDIAFRCNSNEINDIIQCHFDMVTGDWELRVSAPGLPEEGEKEEE